MRSIDCTRCGCNDTTVITEPSEVQATRGGVVRSDVPAWEQPGRAKCNHCGLEFSYRDEPERTPRASGYEIHCPECNSIDTYVSSSPLPKGGVKKRFMKCRSCQHSFKTNDPVANGSPA